MTDDQTADETAENEEALRSAPLGRFVRADRAEILRRTADARAAAGAALPVRIFEPNEDSKPGVVAHFSYAVPTESWSVFGDVTRGLHGLVLSRLEITPESSSGVTAGLLRKIPVGEILASIRTKAAWESAQKTATRTLLGQEPIAGVFDEGDEVTPRRSGRAPLSQELLRNVAMAYIDENAPGKPAGAMKRIAQRFGKPEETMRNWVTRARRDGWLGPSVKGRAGAEAGPQLLAWLAKAIEESFDAMEEATTIAEAYGATKARIPRDAVRAYEDESERDLSHRMGLPPLEAAVVSQVLFGRTLSAELANRERAATNSGDVFDAVAAEMRHAFDKRRAGD